MKLYYAPNACSLAPHIALRESGLPFALVRVNNATKVTEDGRDFRGINPKGYVAALELADGTVLTEGPVILQYLADQAPDSGLLPPAGTLARWRAQEWLAFIGSELHAGMGPLFDRELPDEARARLKQKLFKRLDHVEASLAEGPYLLGGRFGVVDAYLFTVLRWAKGFAIELEGWPRLAAFQERVGERASVIAALEVETRVL